MSRRPWSGSFEFFKQKTSHEITYGDWSSDVCSSDLHHSTARQRADLDAAARLRLDRICNGVLVVACISASGISHHHATDGSACAYQLFPASRPGFEWSAGVRQRRGQPTFVATL